MSAQRTRDFEVPIGEGREATDPVILVIDDDEAIRWVIHEILEDAGYCVVEASDGREGLQRLRTGPQPSLILLDLMMPNMDGWQFRNAQLADATLAQVPVVAFSGDGRLSQAVAAEGVTEFVRKPVQLDDLLAVVARFVPPRPTAR